jgi:hypothetical protein
MIERFKERLPLVRPLFVPLILYLGFLVMAITFINTSPDSPWRLPVLLAPMIPGLFLAIGAMKAIRKLDEMNRKIILESTAVTFAITLFITIAIGLLEIGNLVEINSVYIGLFMVLTWLAAKILITRRYGG